jgi:hypothetical protein
MLGLMFAANTVLATLGQIAAIVICLFVLIFVLLAVVFNVLMAFAMTWVSEKIDLIKMLRPTVESINKTSELVSQGVAPTESENTVVRRVASLPANMHAVDEKVEQFTDRIANVVIEFRARTVQVQTVIKAFLLPGMIGPKPAIPAADGVLEVNGPDWKVMAEPSPQPVEKAVAGVGSTQ